MPNLDLRPGTLTFITYYKGDQSVRFNFTQNSVAYPLTDVTAASFVVYEKNGTAALTLTHSSGLTISAAGGYIDMAITNAQIVALFSQEYNYEFSLTLTGGTVWPILDSVFIVSEDGQTAVTDSDINISLDGTNVDVSVIAPASSGGGGGTWGSITGTLSDQTDLQAALDAKAASSHTHALSDITQSGATTNQVPKWNGSAWVPANEAGGADGNGIYSGSGTIPGATEALLEPNGSFDIHFDGGIGAFVISDGTGSTAIQNKAGTATIAADSTGVIIVADDMLSIEAEGSTGTLNQVLTRGANGAIWQDATGGGASVTQITYAATQTAITNGTLTPGGWYLITDAAGTDLGFLTNAVNENTINVQGVGGYLNADFQAVGDYSNTPETFGAQLGIWRTGFEVVTINYLNLAGGTFAVGDTITGDSTAATAVIVTDDGAASMTAYMTSAGVAFDGSETLDNDAGVTADQDGPASSPTIVQGDCVIWNLLHYQLTDLTLLNGSNPADNTAAYTLLDKATYQETYVTAWDVSEFDFPNAWLQYRADNRGNKVFLSYRTEQDLFGNGITAVSVFQFGKQSTYGNTISDAFIDIKNILASGFSSNNFYPGSSVLNCTFGEGVYMQYNSLFEGSILDTLSLGNATEFIGNTLYPFSAIQEVSIGSSGVLNSNIIFPAAKFLNITAGSGTVIENNILENGASLTGITAGESCSIRGNTIGRGATLGAGTTMDNNSRIEANTLYGDASLSSNTLQFGAYIAGNILQPSSEIYGNTLGENSVMSGNELSGNSYIDGNTLGAAAFVQNNKLDPEASIDSCTIEDGAYIRTNRIARQLNNKTISAGIEFSRNELGLSLTQTETIASTVENKIVQSGLSTPDATIDITGLTTVDYTAAWAQYVGILNLTSSNSTETIDSITNPPTDFPFTIRPAAGLVLTITGAAYAGIAAGQIALKAASYVLDGTKGEYIVLEIDPLGTGALIEKQVVNGLL